MGACEAFLVGLFEPIGAYKSLVRRLARRTAMAAYDAQLERRLHPKAEEVKIRTSPRVELSQERRRWATFVTSQRLDRSGRATVQYISSTASIINLVKQYHVSHGLQAGQRRAGTCPCRSTNCYGPGSSPKTMQLRAFSRPRASTHRSRIVRGACSRASRGHKARYCCGS